MTGTHQAAPIGVLAALPGELGALRERGRRVATRSGVDVIELEIAGRPVFACVGGVGKVAAARAASTLVAHGVERALLVVGTCGALKRGMSVGDFVHCARALQTDLAVRDEREVEPDRALLDAWRGLVPGRTAWFLTADRPVLSFWRRLRLARAFAGDCVADMETAAVGAVAARAGVPWAALRVVTDAASTLAPAEFRLHYPTQAARAADTLDRLVGVLDRPAGAS